MDRAALPRLGAATAEAQRLRKRALVARIDAVRIVAELDNTLLHVGMRQYLWQASADPERVDAPGR